MPHLFYFSRGLMVVQTRYYFPQNIESDLTLRVMQTKTSIPYKYFFTIDLLKNNKILTKNTFKDVRTSILR